MFDLEAGKASRTLKGHTAATTTLDYHLYGDYVASGSLDTIVKVWDLHMASCMQTFQGHSSKITVVSFTPDGRWLTSGDQDGVIKIWDLTAGRLLHEFIDTVPQSRALRLIQKSSFWLLLRQTALFDTGTSKTSQR